MGLTPEFGQARSWGLVVPSLVGTFRQEESEAQLLKMSALCDYETWLLSTYNIELGIPVGMERLTHESWVRHVKDDLPKSEFTWTQYVEHVEAKDGDPWFLEGEPLDPVLASARSSGG